MRRILIGCLGLLAMTLSIGAFAQVNVVMDNGTFFSCAGVFLDSGGQGGPGYQNNEYFTTTICPENQGDVITVDFITFQLDQSGVQSTWDYMAIFDGDNVTEASLGVYTGDDLEGLFVTATSQNTSGCLTFVFQSNEEGTGNFGGSITCGTPCDRPTAEATYDAPITKRICIGDVINFDGSGSFAAPGFEIVEYLWDFADGTTDDSGPVVSHAWDEPGEYVVELFLIDDNGCASTNRVSLQLLVATPPLWSPFPNDTTLCLGEDLCLEAFPNDYELTWSGPEEAYSNSDNTVLEDNVGECFVSEIEVGGFSPGQTLTNVNDLFGIDVSIEHSWLFDLVISIECPTGQTVVLHQQMEQPIGADVASNGSDLGVPDTEFWDYSWTPDATQGTWSQVATDLAGGEALPEGDYNALENLDQLVGCDLNGTWSIEICDLWGGDNGELNEWGLNFNPAIIPEVTEFTPDIGAGSDSSFWSLDATGLDLFNEDPEGNSLCLTPLQEGNWPITFTVINNHGCQTDSVITVSAYQALLADAGEDFSWCGEGTAMSGGLDGLPTPECSADAGNYTYCYTNGAPQSFTYCPDNPGDGIAFMDITFNAGTVENFFDEFWVYDGDNTGAPLLAGPIYGDLSGLQFIATNPSGCITIEVTPDGSVDCAGGSQVEWNFDVGCNLGGPQYDYIWAPATGLSDPNISNPAVDEVFEPTTYELTVFPTGHPDCASTDLVTVYPTYSYEVTFIQPVCFEPTGEINVFIDETTGDGPWDVYLYQAGLAIDSLISTGGDSTFDGLLPSDYIVIIGEETCTYEEEINMSTPPVITLTPTPADTTICYTGVASLSAVPSFDTGDMEYFWNNGAVGQEIQVNPLLDESYTVYATFGGACFTDTVQVNVEVLDPITLDITAGNTICQGDSIFIGVDSATGVLEPYLHTWTWDAGGEIITDGVFLYPEYTANWCCTTTDQCETPAVTQCIEIAISDPIDPSFEADTLGGCVPTLVNFQGLAENPEHIFEAVWDFGDGGISTNPHSSAHTYTTQGSYDITYTVISNDGCFFESTVEDMITIFNWPIAGFNMEPQTAVLPNTGIQFENYSLGSDVYTWVMNNTDSLNDEDPFYEFPDAAGTYSVTLYVENSWGCADSVSRSGFVVDEFVMYVPNAFTPDFDGINDIFRFEGIDVDKDDFKLQIFDRWGEKVFETFDFEQGWNGSYNGGEYFVPDGMYIWRIETRSLTSLERKELIGHVLIMR
ncbi:MAG: PKD domain-containing protein [Flavobacteriales bacterium]|nr:PKD domain-containing protein [Flavobacteriales bacterium]